MAQLTSPKLRILRAGVPEQTINLEKPRFTIGRSGENDLQTNDASVSRFHAEIVHEANDYRIVDKDSKCGTFVNGERTQSCVLKHQDRIQLGNETQIWFLTSDEAVINPGVVDTPSMFMSMGGNDLRNVSKLLETARMFSGVLPLGEILDMVLDMAMEVTQAERAFLVLKDKNGELRLQRARNNQKQHLEESEFQISQTILKQVMETGERVMMSDVRGPSNFAASESMLNLELRTIVCLPLKRFAIVDSSMSFVGGQETVGVLYLDGKTATQRFSRISQGILDSLAGDATSVIENARLLKEAREKDRLEMELATAHEIQATLLPKIEGSYGYFQACACNLASRHISGDYYDLLPLSDGRYGFVIADVSGKGVSAAILTSMVQGILCAEAPRHASLAECLETVNKYLVQRTKSNKFVTLFYGVIEPSGILRFVNAGHNPPYVLRKDGSIEELDATSPILGAFDFAKYKENAVTLQAGDLVCLYTDGITEARNKSGEMLGEEGLQALLSLGPDSTIHQLLDRIIQAVGTHSTGIHQSDDITVFLLRFTGAS